MQHPRHGARVKRQPKKAAPFGREDRYVGVPVSPSISASVWSIFFMHGIIAGRYGRGIVGMVGCLGNELA